MSTESTPVPRRSDLDALRASAMLLGIALHAALSFFPAFWVVSDSRQSPGFGVLFSAIHGFRMPLFFVMSGFFSAMLLARRGRRALVGHRFKRVLVPLLLGLFTIIPLTNGVSSLAIESAARNAASESDPSATIWSASQAGDVAAIERHLGLGAAVNGAGGALTLTPLHHAAIGNQAAAARLLIERGANVNAAASDGGTPLHAATFLGNTEVVTALIEHGANLNAPNHRGETPLTNAKIDPGTTVYFARYLKLPVTEDGLAARKAAIVDLLSQNGAIEGKKAGVTDLLMQIPLFSHLWFLWFLWWLVLGLAAVSALASILPVIRLPAWPVISPARYLWLVPLTMLPQACMDTDGAGLIGPDTSTGILPIPHVLAYYSIFFGFGALYYQFNDREAQVGKRWWAPLALALLLVFPLTLILAAPASDTLLIAGIPLDPRIHRFLSIGLQAAYPWLMTFGCMGLFHRLCPVESPAMRYLSDSAYWLYLAHVPLIIAAQYLVRDWPLPALLKFALITASVTGFLLWNYQTMVRYTWLGKLLNGPRTRPERTHPAPSVP